MVLVHSRVVCVEGNDMQQKSLGGFIIILSTSGTINMCTWKFSDITSSIINAKL